MRASSDPEVGSGRMDNPCLDGHIHAQMDTSMPGNSSLPFSSAHRSQDVGVGRDLEDHLLPSPTYLNPAQVSILSQFFTFTFLNVLHIRSFFKPVPNLEPEVAGASAD